MNELEVEDLKRSRKLPEENYREQNKVKFIVGILAPPLLFLFMFFIYQLLAFFFGRRMGWYFGLFVYWIVCGLIYSSLMIGMKNIKKLIRPQKFRLKLVPFIAFPIVMAFLFSLITGIEFKEVTIIGIIGLVITGFGNGTFEELLWRGVYMELYPKSIFLRYIYPTIWYALYHVASGSISLNSNVWGLVIGSAFFGIYLALLAKKTNTVWWCIVCHVLGSFVMIT